MFGIHTDDQEAGSALCLEEDIVQGPDTCTRVFCIAASVDTQKDGWDGAA